MGKYAGHINVFNARWDVVHKPSRAINDPALQQQTPAAEEQRLAILTNVAEADSLQEKAGNQSRLSNSRHLIKGKS